jgi:single-strand DNA-binding protein
MNLNKVFLIGNLTRDPELRTLPSGMSVTSFGIATNRVWKNQQGERQEDVQFHNIVVFGRQAEIVSQYLTKGSLVLVEGRIQTRSWDGRDGSKQYRTEIIAERIQFGPKNDRSFNAGPQTKPPIETIEIKTDLPEIDIDEENIRAEDLPF